MDWKHILFRVLVVVVSEAVRIVTTQKSVDGQVSEKLDAAAKAAKD